MFSYHIDEDAKALFVLLSEEIKFDFEFLNLITKLMEGTVKSPYKEICVNYGNKLPAFDKMSAAYLYNVLRFFARTNTVFVRKPLSRIFDEKVSHSDSGKFQKIELEKEILNQKQQCYIINNDKGLDKTVQTLVDFIADHNLILENAKEFLITTIGEIFSNAFNHSDEKTANFMFDIQMDGQDISLLINVTDYGKTIVHNVQTYQERAFNRKLAGQDCIRWAMESGNTTRRGSGGYGLPTLRDYVSEVSGELFIFSGDSVYVLADGIEKISCSEGIFLGTSITMKIPLFDMSHAITYSKEQNKIISKNLYEI